MTFSCHLWVVSGKCREYNFFTWKETPWQIHVESSFGTLKNDQKQSPSAISAYNRRSSRFCKLQEKHWLYNISGTPSVMSLWSFLVQKYPVTWFWSVIWTIVSQTYLKLYVRGRQNPLKYGNLKCWLWQKYLFNNSRNFRGITSRPWNHKSISIFQISYYTYKKQAFCFFYFKNRKK